jgi:hypothetical protein
MSSKTGYLTTVLMGAGAVAAIASAPLASAGGADAVISDLQDKGYNVQINWIHGFNTVPLSICTVTRENNPSSSAPKPGDTVYVDVDCPNHIDGDGFGFGGGIG